MLTGIRLTEEQRMQLRDLMHNYRDQLRNVRNLAEDDIALYELVKAEKFDETAVRNQLEKEMRKRLDYQVEMIRVHHQMYQLLNPSRKCSWMLILSRRVFIPHPPPPRRICRNEFVRVVKSVESLSSTQEVFPCHRHHPCLYSPS